MLEVKEDIYNGWIVKRESIAQSSVIFREALEQLLVTAKEQQKLLIWIDLTSKQSQHIAIALEMGFEFHNCEATRTILTYRVEEEAYIPVAPTHTVGVGAVVINDKNELLMVRDRIHTSRSLYKLPGGMLEPSQSLEEGVVRELWEETGIKGEVIKMVSLLNSHPFTFNKSNMYIVFQLEALTTEINVVDTGEIEFALWMPLEEFFAHEEMSPFQKNMVKATLENNGLSLIEYDSLVPNKKQYVEVYS
jgi:ADP-ribose pyrophosphatase YjhB (NUDIX family)